MGRSDSHVNQKKTTGLCESRDTYEQKARNLLWFGTVYSKPLYGKYEDWLNPRLGKGSVEWVSFMVAVSSYTAITCLPTKCPESVKCRPAFLNPRN